MSEIQKFNENTDPMDSLSRERLLELLRAEFAAEDSDLELIKRINAALDRKEGSAAADADAAWEHFLELSAVSEPIYDLDEDEPVSISGKVTKKRAPLKRTLIAVAAVIVILVGGTLIASANGTDLWGTIISWTAETFGFREKAGADRQIPEQLEQLAEYFDQYNISREKLPTYIPEGYVNFETNASLLGADLLFVCGLNNNDKTIIIRYELHRSESFNTLIEKDGDDPEVFKLGDRTFYLFTNESIPCAAWMDGNLECIIFGAESREELIKIIESIYGGKLK